MGQHMAARLLSQGTAVSILCRSRRLYPVPPWASRVRWFELDEGADKQATLLLAASSASVVYDFAGSSGAVASNRNPLESLEANCRSQLEFLMACEMAGHRPHVVYPSSWLVYGDMGREAVSETHPLAPRSMYAIHKLCVERYLQVFERKNSITYTICRISNPYGFDPSKPGKAYKVLNSFIQRALAGAPICLFGDGNQLRDFIYIDDLVDALLLCGYSPQAHNEVFNISSGRSHSLRDAVDMIRELVEGTPVIFKDWPEEYKEVESGSYTAEIAKARTKLGFMPAYDLKAGLEQTILQYRRQGTTPQGLGAVVKD